jgi:hypothetical protein
VLVFDQPNASGFAFCVRYRKNQACCVAPGGDLPHFRP